MICNDLAHVAGWEPYNMHNLGHTYFLGWFCTIHTDYADPAQPLTTAGEELQMI